MFILRQIEVENTDSDTAQPRNTSGVEFNEAIGSKYHIVHRDYNYKSFCELYQMVWNRDHVADLDPEADAFSKNTFAFIVCHDGRVTIPLYKDNYYFIMTSEGKTFENISHK